MLNDYKNIAAEDDPEQTYITFHNPRHEDSSDEKWGGYTDRKKAQEVFNAAMYCQRYMERGVLVGDFLTAVAEADRSGNDRPIQEFMDKLLGVERESLQCETCGKEFIVEEYDSLSTAKTALGVHQTRSH